MEGLIDIGIAVILILVTVAWFCIPPEPLQNPGSKTGENHDDNQDQD